MPTKVGVTFYSEIIGIFLRKKFVQIKSKNSAKISVESGRKISAKQ
jgi:hypothetical protein